MLACDKNSDLCAPGSSDLNSFPLSSAANRTFPLVTCQPAAVSICVGEKKGERRKGSLGGDVVQLEGFAVVKT